MGEPADYMMISGKTIAEMADGCRKLGHDPEKLTPEWTRLDDGISFHLVRIERDGSKVYVAQRAGLYKDMDEALAEARAYIAMIRAAA